MLSTYQYGVNTISCVRIETAIEDQHQTKIYIRAKEAAAIIGYKDTSKSVRDHVNPKYRITFRDLLASSREPQSPTTKHDTP